ncbi:MAG: glycoside hydrolase family 25 protein [Bacteroidales bacterium]|nr:glycoside hydrolase family 25 protein [Bacteroidales bacterium]
MSRRRKKKYSRKKLLAILSIIIIFFVGYYFYPDIISLFKKHQQKSQAYEVFRKELSDYSVFGIDVSHYQTNINWEKLLKTHKIDFVIVRATMGHNKTDSKFLKNWKALNNAKIIKGAYHYYRPDENSTVQAKNYIKNVELKAGDLPPVLDIEKYSRVQSINSLKAGLLNWLEIVEKQYGVTPILYTYHNFYVSTIKKDKRFDKYPVWIAWYNVKQNPNSVLSDWVFWQFTDKGILEGIEGDVDINVFNGKIHEIEVLRIKN